MATQPTNPPRKKPKQGRSRFTVDALLTAAAQVFSEDGFDDATTQRVAELAGVSIGSLYQYYPNKSALLAALASRELDRFFKLFEAYTAARDVADFGTVVRGYIHAILTIYREEPRLHQVLITVFPRLEKLDGSNAIDRRAYELVRAQLGAHREKLKPVNLDAAAFLVVNTVRYNTLAWARDRPRGFDEATLENELTTLVLGYLLPSSGGGKHR